MPLSAAEVAEHPAFNHVRWDLTPTTKGKCAVAQGRGGPFDLAYEIHGVGPVHIVVSHSIISGSFNQPKLDPVAEYMLTVGNGPGSTEMVLATSNKGLRT